jgi:hypothetical protein
VKVYIVQSQDLKYYKSRGQYSDKSRWVDNMEDAKIYTKIGPARGTVTYFATTFPEYGTPRILVCDVIIDYVLHEVDRVKIRKAEILRHAIESKKYYLNLKESLLEDQVSGKGFVQIFQEIEMLKDAIHDLEQGLAEVLKND